MVKDMYSWDDIAYRTERVYLSAMDVEPPPLVERLRRYVPLCLLHTREAC